MEPQLHLQLHQARVADALRRHEQLAAQRPRPPGRYRVAVAAVLHRLAERVEAAPAVRHA
ncbi:hypothetical protein [Salsipaludibacter albus]|uniref:hypothetical protein n=1 Tax=Salsipaludibacter albus TaxID=2849650 RepID=UPI001EE40170|nr:hypothetical protein [Salsipaludibacter albus]MBY5163881.1 hypothetical protein [Salsipaludibacter albus]